jgi:hypothetical protein
MYDRMQKLHEEQVKVLTSKVREIAENLSVVTIGREQEIAKRIDIQEQNKDLRNTIDKLRSQVSTEFFYYFFYILYICINFFYILCVYMQYTVYIYSILVDCIYTIIYIHLFITCLCFFFVLYLFNRFDEK